MAHNKICEYEDCKAAFVSNRSTSKFCTRSCANKSRRVWEIQADGTKVGFAKYQRARRYNLSTTEYDELMEQYAGKSCPICLIREAVVIEHDHDTGVVRGMTCNGCNAGLAAFGDNEEGLLRALAYIQKSSVVNP